LLHQLSPAARAPTHEVCGSSRPGQQWKCTKRPLPVDPYSNNQISALVAVRAFEGGPGVDHVVVVRLTTWRRSKKRRVRDRETFCTPTFMSKGRFVRMIPTCRRPRFRLNTYGRRAFSVAGPTAWNSLPDFVRDATSSTDFFIYESLFTENFRRLLKTYLFARYYCIQRIRVLNDYALYKSTHSLTHSLMATYEGHRPKAGRCV